MPLETLAGISRSEEDATASAEQLVEVGFFERRQAAGETVYWIPFFYRDALGLVQGTEGSPEEEAEDEAEFVATEL